MDETTLRRKSLRALSEDFLDYLDEWTAEREAQSLAAIIEAAGGAEHVGIFCVDVINGFCHEGPLHSKRVQSIIAPIVQLFTEAHEEGVRHFVLTHDAHDPNAAEFVTYPPHCLRGTSESQVVPELMALPFAAEYTLIEKNCIHSGIGTALPQWLEEHPELSTYLVVGDCTDLCTYHLATFLKFRANAANRQDRVLLPMNCVDTYDIPVGVARTDGIPAHPADILHAVFLYNMARNGIEVVREVA